MKIPYKPLFKSLLVLCFQWPFSFLYSQEPFHLGVQVARVLPEGDLITKSKLPAGYSVGILAEIGLGDHSSLRPRIDITEFALFKNGEYSHRNYNSQGNLLSTTNSNILGYYLGLDYLYYFTHLTNGFYVSAGGGFQRWASHNNGGSSMAGAGSAGSGYSTIPDDSIHDGNYNSLSIALGLGYRFGHHFGIEARYSSSKIGESKIHADTLSTCLTFHF